MKSIKNVLAVGTMLACLSMTGVASAGCCGGGSILNRGFGVLHCIKQDIGHAIKCASKCAPKCASHCQSRCQPKFQPKCQSHCR